MFAKTAIISLSFLAVTPVLSAPLPGHTVKARELEARLSFPKGAFGDIIKSLGKGVLSGGAVSGLLALLGEGGSDSSDATADSAATATRDLEARGGLASLLEKLVGAGEETLESVLKKAVIGGVASGAAVEGVDAIANNTRRGSFSGIIDEGEKVAEKGLGSIISNGAAGGVGSALGSIIAKLFGGGSSGASKRGLADLTDDEINTLLEWVNTLQGGSNAVSGRALGSIGKGLAGTAVGLAATEGAEALIEKIEDLFEREVSLNDLD
ncbi:hypothetical protein DFH06DRAFT_1187331 [Mycena polygramma]|nr:hypothetical protein DFH06DRAFT_1187331 [Mycena polygramma]